MTVRGGGSITTPVHFCPPGAWVGDVSPVGREGRFWLFYLLEIRNNPESGTGWALVSTEDFVHYADHGVVLPPGGPKADDFNCYTGHNPPHRAADGHTELRLVTHATSTDGLQSWRKHPDHTFAATAGCDPADWRDPFVFRTDANQPWRMLLAARHLQGPSRRRGVVAQLVSDDLVGWRPAQPFWDPRRYITHEFPDVFHAGGWWYLIYSEFSDPFLTRYRMARSMDGPWLAPELDTIDGRAPYASKSVARGDRRFLVGWIAIEEGDSDDGACQWAGTMSVLELQQRDGTLAFLLPPEIAGSFTEPVTEIAPHPRSMTSSSPDGYEAAVGTAELPTEFYAELIVDIEPDLGACGILVRCSPDGEHGYVVRLEPRRHRVVFDRWPRRRTGAGQLEISGDEPYLIEVERPVHLPPGRHRVEVPADAISCVVIIDRQVALSTRIYDHRGGRLGAFVTDGTTTFHQIAIRRRPDPATSDQPDHPA